MENNIIKIEPIAHIKTDFEEKFGIPRQSGIVKELKSEIIFESKYRNDDALRGIDGYSHLWLIWGFSKNESKGFSPTVRPPRLGGNTKIGVFATRSPYRPNNLGLSLVKLESIKQTEKGSVLIVSGADMVNGSPVYDIKPYLPYTESIPNAKGGFGDDVKEYCIEVNFPKNLLDILPKDKQSIAVNILSQDARPSYQNDINRIYGISFAGYNIKFNVDNKILTVIDVEKM